MTASDGLVRVFGAARATVLREALEARSLSAKCDESWQGKGYSRAILAAVILREIDTLAENPRLCIVKWCPASRTQRESQRHHQAWLDAASTFREHLVRPLDRIRCGDGSFLLQALAGTNPTDMRPLAGLPRTTWAAAAAEVRAGLWERWNGGPRRPQVGEPRGTIELLRVELSANDDTEVPSDRWAGRVEGLASRMAPEERPSLLTLAHALRSTMSERKDHDVVGYAHGDLHGGNVLVPARPDGMPDPSGFQLIDLASFAPDAPLSRDPATLLISLLVEDVRSMSEAAGDALIGQLLRRAGPEIRLLPPVVVDLVDALSGPYTRDGLGKYWDRQWRVSLLAQALLHSTYDSTGARGQRWCARLAAALTRELLPRSGPASVRYRVAADAQGELIGRDDECRLLTEALRDEERAGVILVTGEAGIGKSRIVDEVLTNFRPESSAAVHVVTHEASPWRHPDIKTLIDAIVENPTAGVPRVNWPPLPWLAAAIESLGDTRVVVVLDAAEHLIDGGTIDVSLNAALEVIENRTPKRVKVLLVGPPELLSLSDAPWLGEAARVEVAGLDLTDFEEYVAHLAPGGDGLRELEPSALRAVHSLLGGNPRRTALLQLVLADTEIDFWPDNVAQRLSGLSTKEIDRTLIEDLVTPSRVVRRQVLCALAALGTPVPIEDVQKLVDRPARSTRETLNYLTKHRVVRHVDGRYHLAPADAANILDYLRDRPQDDFPFGERSLHDYLARAALVLLARRTRTIPTDVPGLQIHFAELSLLLRLGQFAEAKNLVDALDEVYLQGWNHRELLLAQRLALVEHLDDFHEMSNHLALADIHGSRGDFDSARPAYAAALRHSEPKYRQFQGTILGNQAAMDWDEGQTKRAWETYQQALLLARENGDRRCEMAVLSGLAACERRWGRYGAAVDLAEQALAVAGALREAGWPGPPEAVGIAVRAARWKAELGEIDAAWSYLGRAEGYALDQADRSSRAQCWDARADLILATTKDVERIAKAVDYATRAIDWVRSLGDPVVALQARTTLCLAYLYLDRPDAANQEITRAGRLRVPGRAFLVLALQAILARENDEATRADELFETLSKEAGAQLVRDPEDLAAWDYAALARCRGGDPAALAEAAEMFWRVRGENAVPTPGTNARLSVLVTRLAQISAKPERYSPVLDAINGGAAAF
ncbi:AAA family ATPase [Cryptosporangium minutisporangium]|uniref:Tetratricopeptide repeat protein n=1 Tax=Cryptosporangium minutisporangium TaxID=113569 RepID=A0ABP6TA83_9ACTN